MANRESLKKCSTAISAWWKKILLLKVPPNVILAFNITEDPNNEANLQLKKALLQRSQQNPDILYNELLSWLFIQQKEIQKSIYAGKSKSTNA